MFRGSFRHKRALIPVNGFYEWHQEDGHKQPYWFHPREGDAFALGAIWDEWYDNTHDKIITSSAIITTEANSLMAPIHDRMPVIIPKASWAMWLDSEVNESILDKLIRHKNNVELSLNCLNDFLYKLFYQRFNADALLLRTSDLVKKGDLDDFYLQQSLSTRQIQRKIKESTGLNPNTIQRINRFYRTLKYIKQNEFNPKFSQITLDNQFADQSHFIKEFKFFTGKTPKKFLLHSQDYLQYNCNIYC